VIKCCYMSLLILAHTTRDVVQVHVVQAKAKASATLSRQRSFALKTWRIEIWSSCQLNCIYGRNTAPKSILGTSMLKLMSKPLREMHFLIDGVSLD
jgi:hypothetical protein